MFMNCTPYVNHIYMILIFDEPNMHLHKTHWLLLPLTIFKKFSLSASLVPQTGVPGVRHSTFESSRLGRSSQSITAGLLRFWDSLNFKKNIEFIGITVLFFDEKVN